MPNTWRGMNKKIQMCVAEPSCRRPWPLAQGTVPFQPVLERTAHLNTQSSIQCGGELALILQLNSSMPVLLVPSGLLNIFCG